MPHSESVPEEVSALFKGKYELLQPIGQGGFGQVYKARQLATEQEVAIKILRPPPGDDERQFQKHLARFRREMRICSRLFHPNIVRPIDSGQTEEGQLYSVFEFIPGRNLAEVLLKEGVLTPGETFRLMLQLLDALYCAHQRGVIHRDIKPHNIMISDTGVQRHALILDFGLSTLAEEFSAPGEPAISSSHEIMGTPAYAAPEQLRGMRADMRSDLFSWGLVFLECLTGERVMKGSSLKEVLDKQLGPEPVPIPEVLKALRLGRLLQRVLEKDIQRRDVSAGDLLLELELCSQEETGMVARRLAMARARSQGTLGKATSRDRLLAEGQMRQLTALCCTVSISPLGDQPVELEEQDRALHAWQSRCIEIAEELGGYLDAVLGRQLMFYFGYPTAREHATRYAARAALRILDEATTGIAAGAPGPVTRPEFRLGIHTGVVFTPTARTDERQDLRSMLGLTPAIASHYQEMAAPDEVLVTEDAHRLLRGDFAFESVLRFDPRTSRWIEASRLCSARAANIPGPEPPLVDRTRELDFLRQRWLLVRQGAGQCILITGEPGIGKSRLVREFLRELREVPHHLLECRCEHEARTSVLRPIIDVIERLLGRERDWPAERCRKELEAMLSQYGFEPKEALPLFSALLSLPEDPQAAPPQLSPEWQKALTFDAFLNLLVEMAAQQPVLLLVEDLHWADSTTLELLTFLLDAIPTARLGVIFTARPDFVPPWLPSQVAPLRLGRLENDRVGELITGLTQGKPLPDELTSQVILRADGIPLFAEELTRMMLESGALGVEPARYRAIPGTLRGLLEVRLDRLGQARETARRASVLGREFGFELLHAISLRDERALQADLSALVKADFLQYRRRLRHPTYLFKHALLRDAAYESIPSAARRELHARVASVLEERFPSLTETRPELLAWHLSAAEQRAKALRYAYRAATKALRRSAPAEALVHAREALGWLDTLPDARARAEAELDLNGVIAPALMATQGFSVEELVKVLQRSRELIDGLGESEHVFPNLWALVVFHYGRGHLDVSLELATHFLELALKTGNVGRQVAARAVLGVCHFCFGHLARAKEELEEALRLYDPEAFRDHTFVYGMDSRIWSLGYLAVTLTIQGQPERARTVCEEAEAWARELQSPHDTHSVLFAHSCVHHLLEERERIPPLCHRMRKLVRAHGPTFFSPMVELFRAWAEEDLAAAERILAELTTFGGVASMGLWRSLVARLLMARGRRDEALSLLQRSIEHHQDGSTYYLPELLRLKGACLAPGNEVEAESCFREAAALARRQGAQLFEFRATTSLTEPHLARGEGVPLM